MTTPVTRRRRHRSVGFVAALALVATLGGAARPPAASAATSPFTDIVGTTFETDIDWLHAEGITVGCTPTLYCPNDPVSRGQMASFLARMFDLPATTTDYFTDDDGTTHEGDINRLAAAAITTGCEPSKFCPARPVIRGEMATFLVRAIPLSEGAGNNYFRDDDGTTHEANIDRLAAAGIGTGCAVWKFCPAIGVTRGQMAAFLHRVIEPVAPPPPSAPVGPQTLHVSIDGANDGNGCTEAATPCGSVRYAALQALPGETVQVGPGTFDESPTSLGFDLTIVGDGADTTVIDASCGPYAGLFDIGTKASVVLAAMTITGCHSEYRQAIANGGILALTNARVTGNSGGIGAIFNSGTLTVTDSVIDGNQASYAGGAIFSRLSVTINDSRISGNTSAGNGGAIVSVAQGNAMLDAHLTVVGSTIDQNASSDRGGAIMAYGSGTVDVKDSTISSNTAKDGAGIYAWSGPRLTVTNSTVAGNVASQDGGGIVDLAAGAKLVNTTIVGNAATTAGALLHRQVDVARQLVIHNTLIVDNQTVSGAELRGIVTGQLNSIVGIPAGMTLADILDPAGLVDNGGPTMTIALTDSPSNPAIDKGHAATCAAAPVDGLDQRGLPRTPPCDIGAYELQP